MCHRETTKIFAGCRSARLRSSRLLLRSSICRKLIGLGTQEHIMYFLFRKMTTTAQELADKALRLAPEDRAELAERLWASLEPGELSSVEHDWLTEIDKREQNLASGRTNVRSWEELKAHLHREFGWS